METQKQIDEFILSNANQELLSRDCLFYKLYNQLGENDDDLREFYHVAFDFSKKKNYCAAMKIGEYMVCGEPCEDAFCHKHILQIKTLGLLPRPCRVCGVGVINTYCNPCILETRERDQSILLAKEFEDDEPSIGSFGWHFKNQGEARV